MGNIISFVILFSLYGSISYHLFKGFKKNGHLCTCKSCPVSKIMNKDGKIDLLFAVEQMEKEVNDESGYGT